MTKEVRLEYDGPIAIITNDNVEKHNAFDDDMDMQLFAALAELKERPDVRAVIWRGEGKSFSSGRDVGAIGGGDVELTHHELMARGHRGILQVFDIEAPIIVAMRMSHSNARWNDAPIDHPCIATMIGASMSNTCRMPR